jgi:signal transduction histidine kinase
MARKIHSITGLAQENKRLTDSLKNRSKLLSDANKELKKATQAKSELLDRTSHELHASLNIIIGFAELMLDEVPGKINDDQKRSLNDILNSGRRLQNLIDNILEWFETESRKTQ